MLSSLLKHLSACNARTQRHPRPRSLTGIPDSAWLAPLRPSSVECPSSQILAARRAAIRQPRREPTLRREASVADDTRQCHLSVFSRCKVSKAAERLAPISIVQSRPRYATPCSRAMRRDKLIGSLARMPHLAFVPHPDPVLDGDRLLGARGPLAVVAVRARVGGSFWRRPRLRLALRRDGECTARRGLAVCQARGGVAVLDGWLAGVCAGGGSAG